MNRFLVILIFVLVACLANASYVTQTLEERLLAMEARIEKLESHWKPDHNWPYPNTTLLNVPCSQYTK